MGEKSPLCVDYQRNSTAGSVSRGGTQEGATARIVSPSTPAGSLEETNSKIIPEPTRSKEQRTTPKGRLGTTKPTTTEGYESLTKRHSEAFGDDELLSRRSSRTVRSSPDRTHRLQTPEVPRKDQERGLQEENSRTRRYGLQDSEEGAVHKPDRVVPRRDNKVNRFDKTKAVQYRSESPSGGSGESEGLASTTISTMEDRPCASPPSDAPTVILECTKTAVISPHDGDYRRVTILFDSGSNTSCVSSKLVKELNLPQRDIRTLQAHVFGSAVPISYDGATVTLDLLTAEGTLRLDVATTERDLPPVRMAPITPLQLSALRKKAIPVPVIREVPDILIGQDRMHLFKKKTLPRLPHGFAVDHTIFGPVISGAGCVTLAVTKAAAAPSGLPTPLVDILEGPPAVSRPPTSPSTTSLPTFEKGSRLDSAPLAAESREPPDSKLEPAPLAAESPESPPLKTTNNDGSTESSAESQETDTSIRWHDHRPCTNRDRWTLHWVNLHPFLGNPLDTDPGCESSDSDSGSTASPHRKPPPASDVLPPPPQTEAPFRDSTADSEPVLCVTQPSPPPDGSLIFCGFAHETAVFLRIRFTKPTPASGSPCAFERSGSRSESFHRSPPVSDLGRDATQSTQRSIRDDGRRFKELPAPLADISSILASNFVQFDEDYAASPSSIAVSRISEFTPSIPGKQRLMASNDKDQPSSSNQLYCNIDDDDWDPHEEYIVPTRPRSKSSKRRPWSGTIPPAPLAEDSTAASEATTSQAAADSSASTPAPLAEASAAPKNPTMPKQPANEAVISAHSTTDADSQDAVSTFRFVPLAHPATGSSSESVQIVVSKQQNKAAALSKIYAQYRAKQAQKTAPKKLQFKLRERAPRLPTTPVRPLSPRPIRELRSAQFVRTMAELNTAVIQMYNEWKRKQPPGAKPLPFTNAWKEHHYGKILWREYSQLEPAVRTFETNDVARRQKQAKEAASTSELPPATTSENQQDQADEFTRALLWADNAVPAMTDAEARQAEAQLLGNEESEQLDYKEEVPVLQPPPNPPTEEELAQDLTRLLAASSTTTTAPAVPQQYRNPSPPREAVTPQQLDAHKQAMENVKQWLHSTAKPSDKRPPEKTKKTVKTAAGANDGHRSRQDSGTKRAHVKTGTSAVPPTQRRRDNSKSPVRDRSPGVNRKNELRVKANRPPIPILDWFMCKDVSIRDRLNGQPLVDVNWTSVLDQPSNDYLFLGGINGITTPSVYLPTTAYRQIQPDEERPLAKLTRAEFDVEQAMLPSKFILAHTFGVFPQYAEMVVNKTCNHFLEKVKPEERYYDGLRYGGIGPTGYNMNGVEDKDYFEVLDDQRVALLRLGRIAHQQKRCLTVVIRYDRAPPANTDLHADAIQQLQEHAEFDADDTVFLALYDGTAQDLLKWLKAFPKTIIGIHMHQIVGHAHNLKKLVSSQQEYRDSAGFRTMLKCIPLDNLGVHSMCPISMTGTRDRRYTPYQLFGIGDNFEKFIETPGAGAALHAHSAANACRVYDLSPELLKHLSHASDRRPERMNLEDFIEAMEELLAPAAAVARADSSNQGAPPMEGVEEAAAAPARKQPRQRSPPPPVPRRKRTPPPTKSSDNHRRRADSKSAPLAAEEKARSSSKSSPAPLAARDADERRTRESRKERSSRHDHRSGDSRDHHRRSRSPMESRSSAHSSQSRRRHDNSPSRRHRRDSEQKRGPKTPPGSPPRRSVILSPSTDGESRETSDVVVKRPTVMSQVVVPNSETNELRIFAATEPTLPPPTEFRIVVPDKKPTTAPEAAQPKAQDLKVVVQKTSHSRTSSTSSRPSNSQPSSSTSRAPVSQRIGFAKPKPFTAKEALQDLHRRRGGELPAPLADAPSFEGPDPLLKPEPMLTKITPKLGTLEEYVDALRPHFTCAPVPGTTKKSISVDAASLATEEPPRAQPAIIHVTHGCDLPWEPIHLCDGKGEKRHFHKTLLDAGLIGARRRWVHCSAIKGNDTLTEFLDLVLDQTVQSFGQMVLIKYAARLRGDDAKTPDTLRFIYEVLVTEDPENDLPEILAEYHEKIVRDNTDRPWPDHQDFYRAAEAWVCYCERAFTYLFEHLNGPAIWNTNWLQSNLLPRAARQLVINDMVNRAQEQFDQLRNQLYLQYGRKHIEAKDRVNFRWQRFDDIEIKRLKTPPEHQLRKATICFVDEHISETFSEQLRPTVDFIVLPDGTSDEVRAFVRRYYPMGSVQRVVFWFGRQFLLDRRLDHRDLVASLCHHFSVYFGRLHQYVVLPAFILDRFELWTDGPLALFVQRAEVVPHARVVLDQEDLHYWYGKAKGVPQTLPDHLSARGRLLTDEAIADRKERLMTTHGLDLWRRPVDHSNKPQRSSSVRSARKGPPAPLADVPTKPTTSKITQKAKEGLPALLADVPSTSTSLLPPPRSIAERFKNDPELEQYAIQLAQKLMEKASAPMAAYIDHVEEVVTTAEQEDAEMEDNDEDALSEPTPYKDRSSDQ